MGCALFTFSHLKQPQTLRRVLIKTEKYHTLGLCVILVMTLNHEQMHSLWGMDIFLSLNKNKIHLLNTLKFHLLYVSYLFVHLFVCFCCIFRHSTSYLCP